jgi:photosystem II stability/assembly factor-like uncharacterized protein
LFELGVTFSAGKRNCGPERESSLGSVSFFEAILLFPGLSRIAAASLFLLFFLAASSSGQVWQRLGPPGGNVISLAAADGSIYLGTADGHVFASTDRGEHWELRGRAGDRLDGVLQRIVVDTAKPDRLLAAVWFQDSSQGGGVFESVDGARHWSAAGLAGEAVRALEQSPSNPGVWIAGARSGVFRSDDDTRSWRRITSADDAELQNSDSLAIDPANPEVIYVGTYHLAWKTTDGGRNWTSIATGMIDDSDVMSLHIDSRDSRRIFSSACSGIYRSEDAGASWTKLQGIPYSSRRTQQIVQDPKYPRVLYAATTEGLWQTSDNGESWKRITPRETVANAVVVLSDGKSSRILSGMEVQGVLRSDDGGASFVQSNGGLSHRVIASLVSGPRGPSHLLVRTEGFGNELLETQDGGISWHEFPAPAMPKSLSEIYGTSSGFWASFVQGGLAEFDTAKAKWREFTFRETMRATRSSRKSVPGRQAQRSTTKTKVVSPRVTSLIEIEGKIVVATDDRLWTLNRGDSEFHRLRSAGLPRSVTYISRGGANSLLAIAGNSVWTSDSNGESWASIVAPENAGRLLWVREDSSIRRPVRLLGTDHGVFLDAADGSWNLVASGLPPLASAPLAFSGTLRLIAMNNGGIYQSTELGEIWRRVDTATEQGRVSRLLPDSDGGFYVASQSEGVLHWSMPPAAELQLRIGLPEIERTVPISKNRHALRTSGVLSSCRGLSKSYVLSRSGNNPAAVPISSDRVACCRACRSHA